MLNEQEKKLRQTNSEYEKWQRIGGVVIDVATLLENLARCNGQGLAPYDAEKLQHAKYSAALVASHALQSLMPELNDEATKHLKQ